MSKRKRGKAEKERRQRQRRQRNAQRTGQPFASTSPYGPGSASGMGGEPPDRLPPALLEMVANAGGGGWQHFGAPEYRQLGRTLRQFDLRSTVAAVAGLLTVPEHQAGTLRLEVLLHLVVCHCRGTRRATSADLRRWIERTLAQLLVRRMEDPLEDICVSNVIAPGGNYRIFEGIWESGDHSLQGLLDIFVQSSWGVGNLRILTPVVALLRLSDAVAERAGVSRWASPDRTDPTDAFLESSIDPAALSQRVAFDNAALASLGISLDQIAPFLFAAAERERILGQSLGHSSLERRPVIGFEDGIVLACPTAVSAACRRYIVETCTSEGNLDELRRALRAVHARAVFGTELRLIDRPASIGGSALPPEPAPPSQALPWDEVHCPIDVDKAAQVILLHDPLNDVDQAGLTAPASFPDLAARLARHIEMTTRHLAQHAAGGLVVIVYAGIGRGVMLGLPHLPPRWHPVVMSAADFATFAWSPDASLLRLWKLNEQVARLNQVGIQFVESNGALNTYGYWQAQRFALCPAEFPYPPLQPSMIQLGTDFHRGLRLTERRLHDVHAVRVDRRGLARVRRLARTTFFPATAARPIYASEELAKQGELAGVYEHHGAVVWVWADKPTDAERAAHFLYQLWEGLLSWLDRLLPELLALVHSPAASVPDQSVVHLRLALVHEPAWRELARPGDPAPARPTATIDVASGVINVAVPFGFISLLRRPTNDGERALLETVAAPLLAALNAATASRSEAADVRNSELPPPAIIQSAVSRAMQGADARFIHLFEASRPTDQIVASNPSQAGRKPQFVAAEDISTWEDGLAWRALDRQTLHLLPKPVSDAAAPLNQRDPAKPLPHLHQVREISGRSTCTAALGAIVDVIWSDIHEQLAAINGPSLVAALMANLEAIFLDREQWRRTARAVTALYGAADDVGRISAEREGRRSQVSNSTRVLVEMAVCACPHDGGRTASLTDMDFLVAGVSLLVELASVSDAIHGALAEPQLSLHPNGMVEADRRYAATITNPFAIEVHGAEFRAAAAGYADLYRRLEDLSEPTSTNDTDADDVPAREARHTRLSPRFDLDFMHAFMEEFGISPDRVLEGLGELVDSGVEQGSLVVATTRGALRARLVEARGFDDCEVNAFFDMLSLVPRGAWDRTPSGFRARDWQPWRFRRRLSLVARPLAAFGQDDDAPLYFGMHQLGTSVAYLFENMQSAWLPEEFFRSDAMLRYRGHIADAEGAAFTQEVAAALRVLGWETRTEVQMSTLGAPPEYGDLDVVAWRADDPRVLLIECKRLQPARTIGEISELLKQFRGEAGDRLGRHVRRCAWIREHPDALTYAIDAPGAPAVLRPLLVTNRDVPMRFRSDLPLSPDQIVPLMALAERIAVVGSATPVAAAP